MFARVLERNEPAYSEIFLKDFRISSVLPLTQEQQRSRTLQELVIMMILLREVASGWFYLGFDSWTPNKALAQKFSSEQELFAEVDREIINGTEIVYELREGMSFTVPANRLSFISPEHPNDELRRGREAAS